MSPWNESAIAALIVAFALSGEVPSLASSPPFCVTYQVFISFHIAPRLILPSWRTGIRPSPSDVANIRDLPSRSLIKIILGSLSMSMTI